MENLCFQDSVSLFVTILVIGLLLPRLKVSAQSDYSRPDKLYINCGSEDSSVPYSGVTFVGDMTFGSNYVSFSNKGTESFNVSLPDAPVIYQTVRIFKRSSSYKIPIDPIGLHFVRLHFAAAANRRDLLTARFTVSATSGSNHHFKDIKIENITETPRVEEFLLMINSSTLELRFVPHRSPLAFINAIEVFSAANDLEFPEFPEIPDKNLHTLYRLNVGGVKISPDNDTLGRTWLKDDDFLYEKTVTRNISSSQKIIYPEGTRAATKYTAPEVVYQSAKAIDHSSSFGVEMLINATWSLKVNSNSKHFVRFHFCNILNDTNSSDFYIYGDSKTPVKPSDYGPVTPFFLDAVSSSDGSGLLNVTIGQKEADANKDSGFLNGIEVMEFLVSEDKSSSRVYIIAGCATAAASALILSVLFMVFLRQRRLKKKNTKKSDMEVSVWSPLPYRGGSSDNRPIYRGGSSDNRPISSHYNNSPFRNLYLGLTIPFTDILRATNNFDEQWLIGRGGFGDVYKAILPDGSKAAIKRGKTGSGQGILEFQTEIQILSRIRHKHLVSLKGYCEEHAEMILVYEFMEKGTLKEHLYGSDFPALTWKQRLEICIGAARGLHYLHSGSDRAIIHRDVKSTNILLDENNIAKVADFGLSKFTVRNQDQTNFSTNIKGTFGYLDPEYLQTHILTEKSDVYAFGVLLLEVLCARPALDRNVCHEEVNLAEWAIFCKEKGTIDEILDPILIGQIEPSALKKFMDLAEKCLKEYGDERPNMGDVIWDLEYVLRLQMLTIHREPHEDSTMTMTNAGSTLVIPRLMISDSFSTTSFMEPKTESKNSHGGTDSSETQVFSQLKISEAR